MPQVVTGNVTLRVELQEVLANGVGVATLPYEILVALAFAVGTGANAIRRAWSKESALAISTPDVWVLSALVDDLGRTIPIAKVRLLVIVNTGAVELLVGNAATNPWSAPFGAATQRLRVKPGGTVAMAAPDVVGLGVTAGASDQLMIDPGAFAGSYTILLAGE